MYVYAIQLSHFRSFDDLWVFPRSDVNILVGPNNSGKSTLLHALYLLLDPTVNPRSSAAVSRFDFHAMDLSHPIELRAWLKPRTTDDQEGGAASAFDEPDEVALAFFDKLSEWKVDTWPSGSPSGFPAGHPRKLVPLVINPMDEPSSTPAHESLLAIRMRAAWNDAEEVAEIELSIVDQMDGEGVALTTKQRELLGFGLVGARRNPLHELSLARRSILAQMLNEEELTRAFRRLLLTLDRSKQVLLDEASVRDVFARLDALMDPKLISSLLGGAGSRFTLTFLGGDLWRLRGTTSIATSMLGASDSSPDDVLPLDYQGDGAQNLLLLLHLLELARNSGRNCIVALEEPEQNLEPALARAVFGSLCSLVRRQDETPTGNPASQSQTTERFGQVFVTTHSPALLSELKGSESLIMLAEATPGSSQNREDGETPSTSDAGGPNKQGSSHRRRAISACHLGADHRKKLDQNRGQYAPALFARHVLIVEGDSEVGFLPVAFRHLTRAKPYRNPYYLGLEIMAGNGKTELSRHAEILGQYGKTCHLLLDYDGESNQPTMEELRSRFDGKAAFVTSWPREHLLGFARGCDLEIILAAQVPPRILFEAISRAYGDAGHPLELAGWHAACKEIADSRIVALLPAVCEGADLSTIELSALGANQTDGDPVDPEVVQRAFVYALLHGPHCCKAVKDMRVIAETLADQNALPPVIELLMERILQAMLTPGEVDHARPDLAPRC